MIQPAINKILPLYLSIVISMRLTHVKYNIMVLLYNGTIPYAMGMFRRYAPSLERVNHLQVKIGFQGNEVAVLMRKRTNEVCERAQCFNNHTRIVEVAK